MVYVSGVEEMSFEEYLDINHNEKLDDLTKFLINDAYKAGALSRQEEIDALQKVIDEALKHVVDHVGYDDLTHVINILKGNKDEN